MKYQDEQYREALTALTEVFGHHFDPSYPVTMRLNGPTGTLITLHEAELIAGVLGANLEASRSANLKARCSGAPADMKRCVGCWEILVCLKTGLWFQYGDEIIIGDLFGCDRCGTLQLHGCPPCCPGNGHEARVLSGELVADPYSERHRAIVRDLVLELGEEMQNFLRKWYPDRERWHWPIIGERS
jgi:hypothetical protein